MAGIDAFSGARSTTNSIDQSIAGSQASVKIDDIKTTTTNFVDTTKTGTIANYNEKETEQEVAIETDPDVQKALARAVISHGGSVKLSDTPAQNPSESAQYGE